MNRNVERRVEFEGRRRIGAPVDVVWCELNNPAALRYCLRRCEALDRVHEHHYRARFRVGIGPIKLPVYADLHVYPDDPPRRYRLRSEITLRAAGSATGDASVTLLRDADQAVLDYVAGVDLEGRIAGHGQDLVDAALARAMRRFFDRFDDWIGGSR